MSYNSDPVLTTQQRRQNVINGIINYPDIYSYELGSRFDESWNFNTHFLSSYYSQTPMDFHPKLNFPVSFGIFIRTPFPIYGAWHTYPEMMINSDQHYTTDLVFQGLNPNSKNHINYLTIAQSAQPTQIQMYYETERLGRMANKHRLTPEAYESIRIRQVLAHCLTYDLPLGIFQLGYHRNYGATVRFISHSALSIPTNLDLSQGAIEQIIANSYN